MCGKCMASRRDSEWEQQRSKLCVFRPSTGGAPGTPKKETEEVDEELCSESFT